MQKENKKNKFDNNKDNENLETKNFREVDSKYKKEYIGRNKDNKFEEQKEENKENKENKQENTDKVNANFNFQNFSSAIEKVFNMSDEEIEQLYSLYDTKIKKIFPNGINLENMNINDNGQFVNANEEESNENKQKENLNSDEKMNEKFKDNKFKKRREKNINKGKNVKKIFEKEIRFQKKNPNDPGVIKIQLNKVLEDIGNSLGNGIEGINGINFENLINPDSMNLGNSNASVLEKYATNLNQEAKDGKIDELIGRDKEIYRLIEILNRRNKNNPCLIGEPGVGKTAIAQGLALKIVKGEVPAKLLDKEIYLLDMALVLAGTQFRGQYEDRIKKIIQEVMKRKNVILVIDEVHTMVSTGSAEQDSTSSAANIFKPYLSKGEIQIIGTTTLDEYRKFIEKDSALSRRFQKVMVEQPTMEETLNILKGIKKNYEEYHYVAFSDYILDKIVKMADKYIHDRQFPDKAIDIMDEVSSSINLINKKAQEYIKFKNQYDQMVVDLEEKRKEQKMLEMQGPNLKLIPNEQGKVEIEGKIITDPQEIVKKIREINDSLEEELKKYKKELDLNKAEIPYIHVSDDDVAKVIERWTKIPVSKVKEEEVDKLIKLESRLSQRVIAQDEAIKAVSKAIRRNRVGLQSTKRPPSFIFVGPTGVGKTELAKAIAEQIFGREDEIIRLDMSEYMEAHSVSKLIGAPPGYIGHGEAGQLSEKVRRRPYSIVLLDEIEKAHPDIFNIFLQILDDGRITDSEGRLVNFENTIIIMTSNVGSNLNVNSIGFGKTKEQTKTKLMEALRNTFRPEFLNRVDDIIIFNSLSNDDLLKIVNLLLENTKKVLEFKNIKLEVSEDAKIYLMKNGTDLKYGARPLRRAIQKYVEDEITDLILLNKLRFGMTVLVKYNKEEDKLEYTIEN